MILFSFMLFSCLQLPNSYSSRKCGAVVVECRTQIEKSCVTISSLPGGVLELDTFTPLSIATKLIRKHKDLS